MIKVNYRLQTSPGDSSTSGLSQPSIWVQVIAEAAPTFGHFDDQAETLGEFRYPKISLLQTTRTHSEVKGW